ncbi:PDR/VanB family oxidoreductase [Pararhizobium mangrovi]|uniref:Oxidoreductase n=1 Tax=Pararhizobium mangrovi TaxID=2590452 RepID=A0A506U004_9HYPH|nr:PDR/VanB family oxidoreductase [Pararhizobium mangrovi]TPW26305.1 oxidoreductase [Pararhizobium mangrovi]
MSDLTFTVRESVEEAPLVRSLVLEAPEGETLTEWHAGAHIRIHLPEGGDRPYSLIDHPDWRTGRHYVVAARLEDESAGGSRYIHACRPGDAVKSSQPINQFELREDEGETLLLAGGIGITPLFSMAAALDRAERPFTLHYLGRAQGQLAFTEALEAMCGDRLTVHYDDAEKGRPDFARVIEALPSDGAIYVCGPAPMIEAAKTAWALAGRPAERLHAELFTGVQPPVGGDRSFEVEIASTGAVVTVGPEQTIIEALEAAGLDIVYDCQRGDCGICQTEVLDGIPEHRDVVLSDEEKASNTVMQICVSRAKTPRLVLDL